MDSDIIIKNLKEAASYIEELDELRGCLEYKNEKWRTTIPFFLKDPINFLNIDHRINDNLSCVRIFEEGFEEYMKTPSILNHNKKNLLKEVAEIARDNNNFFVAHYSKKEYYKLEYYDEKSGYDDEFRENEDGEEVWCTPDLDSFLDFKDEDEDINVFYKISYYIISIAKRISEAVNNNSEFALIDYNKIFQDNLDTRINKDAINNNNYSGLINDLKGYVEDVFESDIIYIIKNKCLPKGREKITWNGRKVDAFRFAYIFELKDCELNKCFNHKSGKEFMASEKPKTTNEVDELKSNKTYSIMEKEDSLYTKIVKYKIPTSNID